MTAMLTLKWLQGSVVGVPSPPKSSIKPLVCNLFSRWRNLFMPTASSLHCSRTLWTVPFPLRCFCQSNTSIVEPLNRAILVITAYHFTIGHLITNAVTWLIWIIGPVNLAIRIRLWYYCCLLRQFLCQCRWRRTWWQRRRRGRWWGLLTWGFVVVFAFSATSWICGWWT